MADVYALMNNGQLLAFTNPTSKTTWIKTEAEVYRIYYKNCTCDKCDVAEHRVLINFVSRSQCISIGFERPVAVEGRMVTVLERIALQQTLAWLKVKKLPIKIVKHLPAIERVVALCERT